MSASVSARMSFDSCSVVSLCVVRAAAAARGVRFVCSTDAHAVQHLKAMRYAVDLARRAGLTKEQVLNARPLPEFRSALKRRRTGI